MLNNYYFLQLLVPELKVQILGWKLATCFSQNKDELVLGFCTDKQEFWIRIALLPEFTLLSFPKEYARAKRNSIDIFQEAIGQTVTNCYIFDNERAFSIELGTIQIIFKLFGNRANVLLAEGETIIDVFRQKIKTDYQQVISHLHRHIEQNREAFLQNGLAKTFPTIGKEIRQWLLPADFETMPAEGQWHIIQKIFSQIQQKTFWITNVADQPHLLLFPYGEIIAKTTVAIEACNEFTLQFGKIYYFNHEKQQIIRELEKKENQTVRYITQNEEKLSEMTSTTLYEEIGHILMANLHQIPPRNKEVQLFDFYRDKNIIIKLNESLSAQKNAENYYRKAKNQKTEIDTLEKNISKKYELLDQIRQHLQNIEHISTIKELRKYLREHQLEAKETENTPYTLFRVFMYDGFEILVGKNAQNNDLLTQKYAYKEDMWLHARDVSGSHVIIKYRSDKPLFPVSVIEKAASLAAYYSQRKHETICPVIYTPKKYVRKPKGLPPGLVVIDREQVLMIEPKPFSETV